MTSMSYKTEKLGKTGNCGMQRPGGLWVHKIGYFLENIDDKAAHRKCGPFFYAQARAEEVCRRCGARAAR